MNPLSPLVVRSGQGDYTVTFSQSLDDLVADLEALPSTVLIVDRHVAERYVSQLKALLAKHHTHLVSATEEEKTPAGVERVWQFLQRSDARKDTEIVVVGGGITQDIAQFAAHNYYRGVRWTFVPTTLLAQADSCIGAKCGINLGSFKNQLGVFHAPSSVRVCLEFLDTLADTEIRSGYGEILKLHLTRSGPELFEELVEAVSTQGWRNEKIGHFIRQSLSVKKGVVEEDEYEKDLRRILNYGHTFGHALEAITHHEIPHGLAVAWGLDLAGFIAWRRGLLAQSEFEAVHSFVAAHFGWELNRSVSASDLIQATKRDKKAAAGVINLILPTRRGALEIVPTAYDARLEDDVEAYLSDFNAIRCS